VRDTLEAKLLIGPVVLSVGLVRFDTQWTLKHCVVVRLRDSQGYIIGTGYSDTRSF